MIRKSKKRKGSKGSDVKPPRLLSRTEALCGVLFAFDGRIIRVRLDWDVDALSVKNTNGDQLTVAPLNPNTVFVD